MPIANNNNTSIGKTKRSTENMIDDAIAQQGNWLNRRRRFTRSFLKTLNETPTATSSANRVTVTRVAPNIAMDSRDKNRSVLRDYWFPILCAIIVILVACWVVFVRPCNAPHIVLNANPRPVPVQTIHKPIVNPTPSDVPTFDIVRIKPDGMVVVAGRWLPHKNISVLINNKIVATERTNEYGEFVYAPTVGLKPGNYTIALTGVAPATKSADRVFLYVSDADYRNSVSLLMTPDGSRVLQSPSLLRDGDLSVTKIDYLDTGRIVVTGDALPRLRVSLTLDNKYIGFARVSDYKHFGLGADVGELVPGTEYSLGVRLHDGDGRTIATVTHNFVMPEMTGDNDTFYTVRRGDCLWIIARNFLRRGVLFSIIADRNNIENPNLIFPEQLLQIPMK